MVRQIEREKLLIVEGIDDKDFFESFLKHEEIAGVEIIEAGGNKNFKNVIPNIVKISGFKNIKTIAVIRDADENANSAFVSIRDILKRIEDHNLTPPEILNSFSEGFPKTGIFILRKPNSNSGILEDLCLATVKNTKAMDCVEIFWDCIVKNLTTLPKSPSKTKCLAYCAAMPELIHRAGLAAKKSYWDLDSKILDELKQFLNHFKD